MKRNVLLLSVILSSTILADVEYVDNVAWSYNIVRGNAHVYGISSPAPVTSSNDTLFVPPTLGGCPVVEIEGGITADWNTKLVLPASVTSVRHHAIINYGSYSYTNRLQWIEVDSGNDYYTSIDGCLYTKDLKTFVRCPQGRIGRVEIASGVKHIAEGAFRRCFGVTEVNLPNTLISIGNNAFNCYLQRHVANTFEDYTALTNINIPASVRFIGDYAFQSCSKLDIDLIIPEGVQRIGVQAFSGCSSIRSLSLPQSLVEIGNQAFNGCSRMTAKFTSVPSSVLCWNLNAFQGCNQIKLDYEIPHGTTEILDRQFYNTTCLRNVTIPNSVTNIDSYAFYSCSSLESVIIPNGVINIGLYAFYGCTSLESVTIPNSVTDIGLYAFYGCSSLEGMTIPDSVTVFGTYPFYGCDQLKELSFEGNPPSGFSVWGLPSSTKIYYREEYANQWNSIVPTTSSYFGGYIE